MASSHASRKVVYAALAGNLLIAVTKFVAAAVTGSSAMMSEGVHSLVDTLNELLLLHGMRRAARPPDAQHPLGHGRELYFWSFVVSLMIFALGAGVSAYEGVMALRAPVPIESPVVSYAVIGLSMLFEGGSWWVALREFRRSKGSLGTFEAVRRSKDPLSFIVLFEDSAALLGLLIVLLATVAAERLDMPVLDGVAALAVAALLAATASILARESKGLLIGEGAKPQLVESVRSIAGRQPGVVVAGAVISVHLAPRQVVIALDLDFEDTLPARAVEEAVADIERRIRAAHPEVTALFVKPKAARSGGGAHGAG